MTDSLTEIDHHPQNHASRCGERGSEGGTIWRVCWLDKSTGREGRGEVIDGHARARRLINEMNREYPGFHHWLEAA